MGTPRIFSTLPIQFFVIELQTLKFDAISRALTMCIWPHSQCQKRSVKHFEHRLKTWPIDRLWVFRSIARRHIWINVRQMIWLCVVRAAPLSAIYFREVGDLDEPHRCWVHQIYANRRRVRYTSTSYSQVCKYLTVYRCYVMPIDNQLYIIGNFNNSYSWVGYLFLFKSSSHGRNLLYDWYTTGVRQCRFLFHHKLLLFLFSMIIQ